jgi:signal transduction histidine kinase
VLKGQHPFIEILVTDTGCGIEEQYWTTIFDRYRTIDSGKKLKPDYSNSGIGLNFTKSLVELNKGAIRVESLPWYWQYVCFYPAFRSRRLRSE